MPLPSRACRLRRSAPLGRERARAPKPMATSSQINRQPAGAGQRAGARAASPRRYEDAAAPCISGSTMTARISSPCSASSSASRRGRVVDRARRAQRRTEQWGEGGVEAHRCPGARPRRACRRGSRCAARRCACAAARRAAGAWRSASSIATSQALAPLSERKARVRPRASSRAAHRRRPRRRGS